MMRREEGGTGRWTEIVTRRMDRTEGTVTEMEDDQVTSKKEPTVVTG